jgi:hypothetical protein
MTGRPKLAAFLSELERQKQAQYEADADGMSHLEYVALCVEAGDTIVGIAKRVIDGANVELYPTVLSTYLYKTFGDEAGVRLKAARVRGSHALVEEGALIIEEASTVDREHLKHAEMRAENRNFRARSYNPAEYGQQPQNTFHILSTGDLHLTALQRDAVLPARIDGEDPTLRLPSNSEGQSRERVA